MAIALLLLAATAGCVNSISHTELPSNEKDHRPVLTKDQQKAAITELARKKQEQQAQALREIEKSK